jgi:hypothetical protein
MLHGGVLCSTTTDGAHHTTLHTTGCALTYLDPWELLAASKVLLDAAQAIVAAMTTLHSQPHCCRRLQAYTNSVQLSCKGIVTGWQGVLLTPECS